MGGFDGSGNYVRYYSWVQDASNNINITASRVDTEDSGFATGLTLCVTRDGQGKMAADFLPATTGSYNLGSAARAWLAMTALQGTIGPPSAGVALTVGAVSGSFAAVLTGSSSSGNSLGLKVNAGSTSGDFAALINNQSNSVTYFAVYGDGGTVIGTPTGGDPGLGGLNIATLLKLAGNPIYAGIPQNSQSAAYTMVLADANKHIYHPSADTTARTWTIDSNANVAYPIGTAITFDNDTSAGVITLAITADTLVWLPSGGTGSRSIAANGQATALKVTATRWHLTGVGIT